MNKIIKPLIVASLVIAAAFIILTKKNPAANSPDSSQPRALPQTNEAQTDSNSAPSLAPDLPAEAKPLPKLVDLGAGKCIPCKMMAPILEELKTVYKDKLEVVFIDVWEHPDQAKSYNINLIPTQIFFSPDGKELFRHEGFFSKEEILAKWKEFGFDLNGK